MQIRTLIAAGAAAALLLPASGATAEEFYAGKTLTLVVPFDPGGSTDTNWRVIAPFLSQHIPGNPEVIIQNMAGGGGNTGANFVYERARPDGLTILAGPWNSVGALTGAEGMRFDYRNMPFLGGFPDVLMTYARRDVVAGGMDDPAQIVDAGRFIFGGLRPDSTIDLTSRLSMDLLGLDYAYVTGYTGAAQRTAAILSGEVQASGLGYVGFKSSVEPAGEGALIGLYYHSLEPMASIDDMMDFPSFYEQVRGEPPSGEEWELLRVAYLATGVFLQSMWAPPGTDEEALEALRRGYASMIEDPALQAEAERIIGTRIDFVTTEQGEQTVQDLLVDTSAETVERLQAYIAAGG